MSINLDLKNFSKSIQNKNVGSPETQILILTNKIHYLHSHFKEHKQDYHNKRGLLKIVSKRRKLLNYLRREKTDIYNKLIKKLNIRH